MRSTAWWGIALGLALAGACGGDDGGTSDDGLSGPPASSTSGTTTSGGGETSGSISHTATESVSASATDTSAGSATTMTSSDTGTTTTPTEDSSSGDPDTGSGACGPTPPDNACLQCAAPVCCTAWANCMADPTCECVLDCHVIDGGSLNSCINGCGHESTGYQELFFCGQQSCLGTCEWDCC